MPTTFAQRVAFFGARLEPAGECWRWTGAQHFGNGGGPYGRAHVGGRGGEHWYAHRPSWEIHRGPIPEGLTIDHLCRNTLCVNPDHLDPVPSSVNSKRGVRAYRDDNPLCPRGHDEWIYRTGRQGRYCAECNRARVRANNRKKDTNE